MKQEFFTYLRNIEMSETLITRIESIWLFYEQLCLEEINDIFVTEYTKPDGSREYQNLWFFSNRYLMEAKNFVTIDNFDMGSSAKRIVRWEIQKNNYDFNTVNPNSQMSLMVNYGDFTCAFKASRNNCPYLQAIFKKYFQANV